MNEWDKLKAVQRMQDHIEAHLTEPITLAALARAAGYSPWHAARLFKEHTGKSPIEYIRLRRLSAAAARLEATPDRVVDVAFDFLFDSHDGFTRAFARQFGMTPRQFRSERPRLPLFIPLSMRDLYLARQKGAPNMTSSTPLQTVFVQVIDRPARKMILKRGRRAAHYFEFCEEVGCAVWDELGAIEGALQEPMGLWLPEGMRKPDTSTYAQGVEVPADFAGNIPEGYELLDLPPCKLMVFQGPPFEDKEFSQAIASLWEVMKTYRPELYGFTWADEDAPRFQFAPLGYRGYIEGRPVRPVNATR